MRTPATLFRAIVTSLRTAVAPLTGFEHPRAALFILLVNRICRMANRFDALFAKWQAGTLPKPRPSRAGPSRADPSRVGQSRTPGEPRARPRLPGRRAWLLHVTEQVRLAAAICGTQLQHQFATPDFAAFLQAAPQAGRILRPLCRMIGIDPPPECAWPPRRRASRKAVPPSPGNAPSPAIAGAWAAKWTERGGGAASDPRGRPNPTPLHPIYPIGFRPSPFRFSRT